MRTYFMRRCAKMIAGAITKIPAKAGARVFAGVVLAGVVGIVSVSHGYSDSKGAAYVQDSSDYTSFGIDSHDIDRVIEGNIRSLLDSDYVRSLQGRKLLMIADIANKTDEDIDVELMARKLARAMRKSGKFTLTNAIAGSGAKADKTINDSRKLTKDPRFNQYTTQEQGSLEAPELSLSGKIVQRAKRLGEVTRLDYMFLLTLSDLKSGKVLWDHEEIISKVADASVSKEITRQNEAKQKAQNLQALREQCRREKPEACETLFQKKDMQGLQRLCNEKVGLACMFVGHHFESKNDMSQAKLWHHKGCELGNVYSCSQLGIIYDNERNYTQAFMFYATACVGGYMESCANLGNLYQKGQGVEQNGAMALELYVKACEGKEEFGCFNAGVMYGFGKAGVEKDFIKARSYYHKACELGGAEACFNLGVMYENGGGGKQDSAKALDLYEKACDLGNGFGCNNAGNLYYNKQQYGKARKLTEKGCELNNGTACYNLALGYHNGEGARQDYKQAKELYGKACDLGYQDGCEWYKKLRDAGY